MKRKQSLNIISMFLVITVAVGVFLSGCSPQATVNEGGKEDGVDSIFINGNITPVTDANEKAEAIAVKDGKISAIGTTDEITKLAGESTETIDLGGKQVLPGFFDAHAHIRSYVRTIYDVDLKKETTVKGYQDAVRAFVEEKPETETIRGSGWSNTVFPPSGPTKDLLDEITTEKAIVLSSEDGHSIWVNSKALELGNVTKDTPDPPTGSIVKDKKGEPTGCLRESARTLVNSALPDYTIEQYKEGILGFQDMVKQYGITGALEAYISPGSNLLDAYLDLAKEDKLSMWIRAALLADPQKGPEQVEDFVATRDAVPEYDKFKITTIKVFADGVVEGLTASLLDPYESEASGKDADFKGDPEWQQENMNKVFAAIEKAGFRIHVHSIGDGATKMSLDALEYAREQNNLQDMRHAFTHLQLVAPKDFQRFADLGVVAAINPYWMFKDDYYYNLQLPYLGEERAELEYPVKSFLDNGVILTAASDYSVTNPPNPMEGIQIGVTRTVPKTEDGILSYGMTADKGNPKYDLPLWPEESVTVEDMVKAFTYNGAWANNLEEQTGSLEIGKSADFIVLDEDIFEADKNKIREIPVLYTYFQGKEIYKMN